MRDPNDVSASELLDLWMENSPEAVSYTHLDVYKRQAIWSRPSQLSAGLSEISGWITNVYAGCVDGRFRSLREYNAVAAVKKPYKYVFIDRLTENIPEKELESLARIARNGAAAGVYMIEMCIRDSE